MTKKIFFEYSRHHRALFKKSFIFVYRKQVRVDEIFLHENFTTTDNKANDIALLRLGENQHQTESVLKKLYFLFEPFLCLQRKGLIFPLSRRSAYLLRTTIQKEVSAMSMVRRKLCCLWREDNFVFYGEEKILFE